MLFSSKEFLLFYLPFVLLIYYLPLRKRGSRNLFLTIMSLIFYAWGEPSFVLVMLLSIVLNWLYGLLVDTYRERKSLAKMWLALMCVTNIGLLGVFKYLMFIMNNLNWAFGLHLPVPELALPIGISFFTFQSMSYVIDVYHGKGEVQKNFFNVCLYISFFPQLIAGPIVRYQTVAEEIKGRHETIDDFSAGARRFIVGLGKKVILANNLALVVDTPLAAANATLTLGTSWLVAICYLIQVYYDFSGYSDMAIGLGRMFGFHFLENFDYPFLSKSITELWRRWHISLSSWFRDYVFFPLGGSRVKSTARLLLNMLIVWSLTGLWHGADWNYLLWGVSFFVILAVEKLTGLGKWMEKHWFGHVYAMLIFVVLSILIRADGIGGTYEIYRGMFALGTVPAYDSLTLLLLREYGAFIAASIVLSLPVGAWLERVLHVPERVSEIIRATALLAVLVLSVSYVAVGGYNPFIYFNF